ncbi:MAG: hypothetical protein ACYC5M_01405 [Anaerolineae bacterium]
MADEHAVSVFDVEGKRGTIRPGATQEGSFGVMVRIELEDGCFVLAPAERLRLREDGNYMLPWHMAELERCDEKVDEPHPADRV